MLIISKINSFFLEFFTLMFLLKEGHQFSTVSSSVSHFCPPSQPFWQARFKMIEHLCQFDPNSFGDISKYFSDLGWHFYSRQRWWWWLWLWLSTPFNLLDGLSKMIFLRRVNNRKPSKKDFFEADPYDEDDNDF